MQTNYSTFKRSNMRPKLKTAITVITTLVLFSGFILLGFWLKNNFDFLHKQPLVAIVSVGIYLTSFYFILNIVPEWLSKKL